MKLFIRVLFLYVLTYAIPSLGQNQPCNLVLKGQVIDEHSGEALPFASIYLPETEIGTTADSLGHYQISGLCPGMVVIICDHVGCDPVIDSLELSGNTIRNLYPEHHAEELNAVIVHGERDEGFVSLSKASLKKEALFMTRGENLGESLKRIPGVTTLNTGATIAKPVIHGMQGTRVLIMNNGIRMESQQWGNEHAPEIDPFIADELTVVKGAQSVQYGPDAIGGVILVNPKPLNYEPGIRGEVNLVGSTNGWTGVGSAWVEAASKKLPGLSGRIQGTYKRGGNLRTPNYYLKNTGIREYNFSWGVGYERNKWGAEVFYSQFNTDIGIFAGAHIGNLTDLQNAFEAPEPLQQADFTYEINRPYQSMIHELFKGKAWWRTSSNSRLTFTYGRQYNEREEYDSHIRRGARNSNDPELQFEITTHTGELAWEHGNSKGFSGKVGAFGMDQKNTAGGRYFIPNFEKQGLALFALERYRKGRWYFEAGVRHDWINQDAYVWDRDSFTVESFNFANWSFNLGTAYRLNENLEFTLNIGSAWRPPYVNELFSDGVHHGSAAYEIGNPNLTEEISYQINAGVHYNRRWLHLQADAYYANFDNFIYLRPKQPPTLTIRGAFPTFVYDQVPAHYYGLDLSAEFEITDRLSWLSKLSIVRAYEKTTDEFLVFIPADRIENEISYKLTQDKRNLRISAGVLNVAKQWRVNPETDYVPPPDAYMLVSAEASGSLFMGAQEFRWGVRVTNLMNTVYRDYMNRFRYFADDIGRNFTLKIAIPINQSI